MPDALLGVTNRFNEAEGNLFRDPFLFRLFLVVTSSKNMMKLCYFIVLCEFPRL